MSFSRLDLHLRRNVSCSTKANKMFASAESQQQPHSGQIADTWSYNTFQKVEFEQGESPAFHLKPAISLPNCQQKHEWVGVNQHIEVHTAPRVYAANTVEEKASLCTSFSTQLESGNWRKRTTTWRLNSQPAPERGVSATQATSVAAIL